MNKGNLLLIGGGGHCKSVLDSILSSNQYMNIGIVDNKNCEEAILGVPVIGCDDNLPDLYLNNYKYAFITLGSVGEPSARIRIYTELQRIGFTIPNIIDLTANISKNVILEQGIFVGKNAVINVGTKIGNCSIINTSSTVEHDCIIGDFVHIAPGAVVCGGVNIGDMTHIGANSTIKQQVTIGENCIIGAGAVVIDDVPSYCTVVGNPARIIS